MFNVASGPSDVGKPFSLFPRTPAKAVKLKANLAVVVVEYLSMSGNHVDSLPGGDAK